MQTDGRKIVKDLIVHRSLWNAVFSGEILDGRKNLIKLRDIEKSLSAGMLCVSVHKTCRDDFERIAEKWNPAAMQVMPASGNHSDDLVLGIFFPIT